VGKTCHYCGGEEDPKWPGTETRPYGPGGADVCADCGLKPENEETTRRGFEAILAGAEAAGGGIAVLDETGVHPFDGKLP
jgi:hypothetical protein